MKRNFKKILLILGFGVVILTIVFVIISRVTMGSEIKLGGEEIPSLYEVTSRMGVYKIKSSEDEIIVKKLFYKSNSISVDDLNEYIEYLVESGFITTKDFVNNSGELGKKSKDTGEIILINIKFSEEGSVIKYTKKLGNL